MDINQKLDGRVKEGDIIQDLNKSNQVKKLCEIIMGVTEIYENGADKIYFDYDGVIRLLEQAKTLATESARCPRPDNLPSEMAWDEMMYDGDEDFDPYVYTGTMSEEDFERASNAYLEDEQDMELE